MAHKQTIRKNIVTGEWEHYVDVPLFEGNHWVPGLFNYFGEFPPTETSQSLMRNGEGYLLSYEDVKYEDYNVVTTRNLARYEQVINLYPIQFTELYTPTQPLTIEFIKRGATETTIDIAATIYGGYPYRHPDVHYELSWKALEIDSRFVQAFETQRKNSFPLELDEMGIGKYELTITDANRVSYSQVVEVKQSDFKVINKPGPKPQFEVNLWFWSDDKLRKRGYLRATVGVGESVGPYTVEWKRGTVNSTIMRAEIVDSFLQENTIYLDKYVGYGTYSIVITDSLGNIVTDTEEVTDESFPPIPPSTEPYQAPTTNPEDSSPSTGGKPIGPIG